MSVPIHLKILCLHCLWICLVFTQRIQLHDYSQHDSITKCNIGLLRGVDQSSFKAVVTLDKDVSTLPYVGFVQKEKTAELYDHLLTLSLEYNCEKEYVKDDSLVNCSKKTDTEFHITVLTKALPQNSGASIKGFIGRYNPNSTSIQLPQNYESTAANGTLSINGHIKSPDIFCNETIYKEKLNIEFSCSSSAQPCVAEIYLNDSIVGTHIKNGALYNGKVQNGQEVIVTIKYAACRLDGKYNTMTCRINASYTATSDDEDGMSHWLWLGIAGIILILLVLLVLLVICVIKLIKYKKNHPRKTKSQLAGGTDVEFTSSRDTEQGNKIGERSHLMDDDANEKNKSMSLTPEQVSKLIQAAEHGDFGTVSSFINNYEAIDDAMTPDGVTVLMKASEHGHKEIVELLIENGANVNQETAFGKTAIQLAECNGHVEIVALLKKKIESDLSQLKLNIKIKPDPYIPQTDSKQDMNV